MLDTLKTGLLQRAVVRVDVSQSSVSLVDEFILTHEPKLCASVTHRVGTPDSLQHYTIRYLDIDDVPLHEMLSQDSWYVGGFIFGKELGLGRGGSHIDGGPPEYSQGARDALYYFGHTI